MFLWESAILFLKQLSKVHIFEYIFSEETNGQYIIDDK